MPQYLATKADPKVRHIRRNCSALKKLIDDESVDFTKDDIVPMTDEQLAAHRKEFGNGDGNDGHPAEAGRCPVCWNEAGTRSAITPNQREKARRAKLAERAAKKLADEQKKASDKAKDADKKEKEPVAASKTSRSAVTRKKEPVAA